MGENAKAGWYDDPGQADTQRYWDGEAWTDQRAPKPPPPKDSSGTSPQTIRQIVAGVGAGLAVVGVFLPMADIEGSIPIADNTMIQHTEGVIVLLLAIVAFLSTLKGDATNAAPMVICGIIIVGVAYLLGSDPGIEYRSQLSEAVAGDVSPGVGVWAAGLGGLILMASPFINRDG